MRHATIILTLLLVSAHLSFAQGPPDSTRLRAARQFQQEHGFAWQIIWHEKAGTPATLMGGKAGGYGALPEQAGRTFLREYKTLFGIENARRNLRVAHRNTSGGNAQILYQQVYKGIPVLHSGYLVAINKAGQVYYVSGDYYPEINVSTTPSLQPPDVVHLMRRDLGAFGTFKVLQAPKLSIYVDHKTDRLTYHLAYEAKALSREPLKGFLYVVDAQTGEVLYKASLVEEINGSGDVYTTNPSHGNPVSVSLHRLRNLSPRRLDGTNIVVTNEEAAEATSSSGDFSYNPSNTHFDEVMVYYHSDRFEAWLIGLGMGSSKVAKVTAETHSTTARNLSNVYAVTFSSLGEMYFSDGEGHSGLRNPTREAAVITHEYMHVVSEAYNSLTQNNQADAMDEAYSDYFGIRYRWNVGGVLSSVQGEYIDEPGGLNYTRDLDNSHAMSEFNSIDLEPDNETEAHDRSVIFSGALWSFLEDPDTDSNVDEIVLKSLKHLDANPTFLDGRNALITAADNAGYPEYECDIKVAFWEHGIGARCDPPPAPTNFRVTNVNTSGENPHLDWNAVSEADQYHLYRCVVPSGSTCQESMFERFWTTGNTYFDDFQYVTAGMWPCGQSESQAVYRATSENRVGESDSPSNWYAVCVEVPNYTSSLKTLLQPTALPEEFALEGNAPNPFNERTTIHFALPEAAHVRFVVYDVMGREVIRLVDEELPAGYHTAPVDASDLASGIYIYRMTAGEKFTDTGRMVVVR